MMSQSLETLEGIARKKSVTVANDCDSFLVKTSVDYLQSKEALSSIEVDPYWPKWDGPWWHMLLLHELGLVDAIPKIAIEKMLVALNEHYLPVFPVRENELPAGVDPLGQIACHCQLGEIEQVLSAYGIEVDSAVPAFKSWYLRYQLPDGGLNCDESAYVKDKPVSSIVSTLPPLETVLSFRKPCSNDGWTFLERGAQYLIDRKLFRSARSGVVINEDWTKLCFPRFYEYDILRGLNFLLSWSAATKTVLPVASVIEVISLIDDKFPDGCLFIERSIWTSTSTRYFNPETKGWSKKLASAFPLLEAVGSVGIASAALTADWNDAKQKLDQLLQEGLLGI